MTLTPQDARRLKHMIGVYVRDAVNSSWAGSDPDDDPIFLRQLERKSRKRLYAEIDRLARDVVCRNVPHPEE